MRRSFIVLAAVVAALIAAAPASAITHGRPDGGDHPYVALMQAYDEKGVPIQVCSGALLSPTLFLTAAHCVAEPEAAHAEVFFDDGPILPDIDYLLALFLDPNFTGSCDYSPDFDGYPCFGDSGGTPHAHPDFCFGCRTGLAHEVVRDVAVVTLDEPVPASTVSRYARLPDPDQVAGLANRSPVDIVGYGVQYQTDFPGRAYSKPPPYFRWAGSAERMRATAELVGGQSAISDGFVSFTQNAGGMCFGDSGGPDLVGGTDTVVAVNSFTTNYNCRGVGYSQRVDVPEILAWIKGFMG